MSKPANPLARFVSYEVKHVMVAFDSSDAACKFSVSEFNNKKVGEKIDNIDKLCGNGIYVVNEVHDPSFFITRLEWSFDFFNPVIPTTTSCVGRFSIVGSDDLLFSNFMRDVSDRLGISLGHMTFALFTMFRGKNGGPDALRETLTAKPLIFNIVDFNSSFDSNVPNTATYDFVAQYNTLGQLPQFANPSQMTLTNADGGVGQMMPLIEGTTSGIKSRKEENRIKEPVRKARIRRSSPMESLKDLTSALEQELNSQTSPNRRNIQEFIGLVRDDFVKKIDTPHSTIDDNGGMKLNYTVKLDAVCAGYPVNNRNLPFEQPEQNQNTRGIASMTLPLSSSIVAYVNEILKTSQSVANDAKRGYSYKTNIATFLDCDGKYNINISIHRFKTPRNEVDGKDGPEVGLQFFYGEGKRDHDILNMSMAMGPNIQMSTVENESVTGGESSVIYGDREQITVERSPSKKMLDTFFSGLRGASSPRNYGLESGSSGATIDINNSRFVMAQTSYTLLTVAGNFDLYSDLCRNPMYVISGEDDQSVLFKFPEYEPMYIGLVVRVKNDKATDKQSIGPDQSHFYYNGSYHVASVTNIIDGSTFIQKLRLLRTDDSE